MKFDDILKYPYAIVIIILLILLVYIHLRKTEYMRGLPFAAGATARFYQSPTSTNQRPYETGYNFQKTSKFDDYKPEDNLRRSNELFSNGRNMLSQEEILAKELYGEGFTDISDVDSQINSELNAAVYY